MEQLEHPFDIYETENEKDDNTVVEIEVVEEMGEAMVRDCDCCDDDDKHDGHHDDDCEHSDDKSHAVCRCIEKFKKSDPIWIRNCNDVLERDLGNVYLESQGRMLEVSFTLKNVCPGKRTAAAIVLHELNCVNAEKPRGFKTIVIPAHHERRCSDVYVKCVRFVLPEELDASGNPYSICDTRRFIARVTANYIDTNFTIAP